MSLTKEDVIKQIQANAVRNGYDPISEAGANLILHEL